jgi:thiamine-phosphate pyrophosphorylase
LLLSDYAPELSPGSESLLRLPPRGLYAVTPAALSAQALLQAVHDCLKAGAVMLQYRAKDKSDAQRMEEARNISYLTKEAGAEFIINDDIALAKTLRCGVHLGERDVAVADAREVLGPAAIIGASCYDSLVLAQRAADAGASYLAFGAFYPTQSKKTDRMAEPAMLHKAAPFGLPLVAIGGITPENGAALISAGADYLAVIGALFDDPAQTFTQAKRFTALFH